MFEAITARSCRSDHAQADAGDPPPARAVPDLHLVLHLGTLAGRVAAPDELPASDRRFRRVHPRPIELRLDRVTLPELHQLLDVAHSHVPPDLPETLEDPADRDA